MFRFPLNNAGCKNNLIRQGNSGRRADSLADGTIITGGGVNDHHFFVNQGQRLCWTGSDTFGGAGTARYVNQREPDKGFHFAMIRSFWLFGLDIDQLPGYTTTEKLNFFGKVELLMSYPLAGATPIS
jgi:hypothetical protein